MRYTFKENSHRLVITTFSQIQTGELFLYGGVVYMKSKSNVGINMHDGEILAIDKWASCSPLIVRLELERLYTDKRGTGDWGE